MSCWNQKKERSELILAKNKSDILHEKKRKRKTKVKKGKEEKQVEEGVVTVCVNNVMTQKVGTNKMSVSLQSDLVGYLSSHWDSGRPRHQNKHQEIAQQVESSSESMQESFKYTISCNLSSAALAQGRQKLHPHRVEDE